MEFNSAFARGAGVTGMKEAILHTHATQDEAAFACMRFVDRFWSVSQVLIVASPLTIELDSLHTRRQQQTKRLFNQIVNKPEHTAHITCYPLQENSLSLIVSDLPTNCRAYLQRLRLTDSKTLLLICYSLNSLQ